MTIKDLINELLEFNPGDEIHIPDKRYEGHVLKVES